MTEDQTPPGPGDAGGIQYAGGSGRSREDAVVIRGAVTTWEGVQAERTWLEEHFARFVERRQLLTDDRRFDVVEIETADGESKEIWFDVSEFFGK